MNTAGRVFLKVSGQVQGVAYRYNAMQKAFSLGITGWTRNNANGTVDCLAEGQKDKLNEFISWCQTGSSSAVVEKTEIKWLTYQGEFKDFFIKH